MRATGLKAGWPGLIPDRARGRPGRGRCPSRQGAQTGSARVKPSPHIQHCPPRQAGAIGRGSYFQEVRPFMSVDEKTVRRIAHLARIAVTDAEVPHLQGELNAMLAFVEQLSEVNVDGVEPMTSVTPMEMKKRADVVNDGEIADDVVKSAPDTVNHFFLVPKVVE